MEQSTETPASSLKNTGTDTDTGTHTAAVTYRTHRPGDLSLIVHRHAILYLEELGCEDPRFESYISRIAADFLLSYDSSKERCWVAEMDGQFVGSILLIQDDECKDAAKLRLFLVELKARRLGVGKKLMEQCIAFARQAGYARIRLRTDSGLLAARGLYKREGFEVLQTIPEKLFHFETAGEVWEKKL